ncbi:phytanoyl-CoA dioxygenase family protein [Paenibacillus swuensis]|uniref:phytanoyl-CoA dioxygenase family protein n=1 Tax=Paenibacillus swuensis TaxID=1178515 RepID=UPI000839A1B1|nr:phytanoyl-CoA dioxygenase family protein [Paenibacillus swuensis]
MLNENQLKQYEQEGYIILESLFSAEEIDALTKRIDILDEASEAELVKSGHAGISTAKKINFTVLLNQKDDAIKTFASQQKMVDITTSLLGPDVKLYWDQSVYKRPEADRDFPWHQDNGYAPTQPEHYVTCWLALEDATIENGCIWIHPGSHKQGFVEHRDSDVGKQCYFGDDPGMAVPLKKGSMVVFHSLLFHRSTPNRSNTTRKGYIMQYSVDGAFNPVTGAVYNNGPVIALEGKAYSNQ